jgi:hypothetical protein
MPISIEVEKDGIILYPICIGIGRILPLSVVVQRKDQMVFHMRGSVELNALTAKGSVKSPDNTELLYLQEKSNR